MLKAITNTLPTRQILHKWFPKEHAKATCDMCGKADESIAHFTLNCEKLADATTAAHDIACRRLSKALEKTLTKSPYRWVFHWEKQAGLAFPGLVGTQGSHNWDALTEVWINLSIPSCDLDKLRPDGIHFCYNQSGIIQHTVIFEFTRANDKFEGFSGDTRAQKHIRYEPLRRLLEQITTAPCYLAFLVMGFLLFIHG